MITIKNMHNEKPDSCKPYHVRVDRVCVLGNPFFMELETDRGTVIIKYRQWFALMIDPTNQSGTAKFFMRRLRQLQKLLNEYGMLELYCWCDPLDCHAEIIKDYLLGNV